MPILEHGPEVKLIESAVCAEYIAEAFPGQGTELLPPTPLARAKMRLLGEMWAASGVANYWALLLAGMDKEEEKKRVEVEKLKTGMKMMDGFLRQYGGHGKGPYLLESGFCVGEVCIAPFVQRLLIVLPHWAQVDPLALAQELGCGRLQDWMEALAMRPATVASGGSKEETIANYTRLLAMMKGNAQQAAK